MPLQEAMENFVFPNEINKTKLMKMFKLMSIFPILTGILQKKCKRSFFLFTLEKQSKRPLRFDGVQRQMH